MGQESSTPQYRFSSAAATHAHAYILPKLLPACGPIIAGMRVLDVGCGNGSMARIFSDLGCRVVGIDLSQEGIALARTNCPGGRFELLPADEKTLDNLRELPFDLVVSCEVVEHLFDPRAFARGCYKATRTGGRFVCTTPFHGYMKNLLIGVAGKWDSHANPLWDVGHIKLWSRRTLSALLREAGFEHLRFAGVGRTPWLWKSMIIHGDRVA